MNFKKIKKLGFKFFFRARNLLDLKEDFDEDGATQLILANLEFRSGNAWSLIFAILIASVGLNVNSTAVIIGAMLISPLMGPIVGAGFALAVHDYPTLKKSAINLFYAAAISIGTSTFFFLFTPSFGAQSELIARTQPNFYDVLIAFFGGATGIIASTRKVKSNAIPGVAIATALMPPLCTAGYGFAKLNPLFALGALYLFLINSFFIFISTYLFVRILKFKVIKDRDPVRDNIIHKWMGTASTLVIIPSIFMVWYLHKKTTFENSSQAFIDNELASTMIVVGKPKFNFGLSKSSIQVRVLGIPLTSTEKESLEETLKNKYFVENSILEIDSESKDNLTLAELDQMFLTKHDFFNLQQLNDKKEKDKLIQIINTFNESKAKLNSKNNYSLSVNFDEDKTIIEITWKKKPTSLEIKNAENTISNYLFKTNFIFQHK